MSWSWQPERKQLGSSLGVLEPIELENSNQDSPCSSNNRILQSTEIQIAPCKVLHPQFEDTPSSSNNNNGVPQVTISEVNDACRNHNTNGVLQQNGKPTICQQICQEGGSCCFEQPRGATGIGGRPCSDEYCRTYEACQVIYSNAPWFKNLRTVQNRCTVYLFIYAKICVNLYWSIYWFSHCNGENVCNPQSLIFSGNKMVTKLKIKNLTSFIDYHCCRHSTNGIASQMLQTPFTQPSQTVTQ